MNQVLKVIASRFSMKRVGTTFIDSGGWNVLGEYVDKFGDHWIASYPFYPWSFRNKQAKKFPCKFDHNGECLVCDCWASECAWLRYLNQDYRFETQEELEEMFKPNISNE